MSQETAIYMADGMETLRHHRMGKHPAFVISISGCGAVMRMRHFGGENQTVRATAAARARRMAEGCSEGPDVGRG